MTSYVNVLPFKPGFDPNRYSDQRIFVDALSIYRQYRLDLQLNWFTQEQEHYKRIDGRTETAAGTLLFLGAVAAFLEGVLPLCSWVKGYSIRRTWPRGYRDWIDSSKRGVRVYRSASGVSESAERYQRLAAQLGWRSNDFAHLLDADLSNKHNQDRLLALIFDVERLCHGELVEFIRVAGKSDYIL